LGTVYIKDVTNYTRKSLTKRTSENLPKDSTEKSKCNSEACRLEDFNFPDMLTAFTYSEIQVKYHNYIITITVD